MLEQEVVSDLQLYRSGNTATQNEPSSYGKVGGCKVLQSLQC